MMAAPSPAIGILNLAASDPDTLNPDPNDPSPHVRSDVSGNGQPPSPEWPCFKFEPVDANCSTCGTPIHLSPHSLGCFDLTLMPASKSVASLQQELAAVKAEMQTMKGE